MWRGVLSWDDKNKHQTEIHISVRPYILIILVDHEVSLRPLVVQQVLNELVLVVLGCQVDDGLVLQVLVVQLRLPVHQELHGVPVAVDGGRHDRSHPCLRPLVQVGSSERNITTTSHSSLGQG